MANKEKLLLLAMISMMLPGAMPDAFADGTVEPEKKAKRSAIAPDTTTGQHQSINRQQQSATTK